MNLLDLNFLEGIKCKNVEVLIQLLKPEHPRIVDVESVWDISVYQGRGCVEVVKR